jgi:PKD repeat protein
MTLRRALALFVTAALVAGCRLTPQEAPALAGPSELSLSLAPSATPDVVSHDGRSQSLLTVTARGPNGDPVPGLSLRLAMFVGGTNVDYGTLSSKSISTDGAGFASALYTAPPPPPPTVTSDTTVDIQILPVGTDFSNTTPRWIRIRLARPGVILPPNPPLVASFFFSPTQPRENERVRFDASASTGAIVSRDWSFGDGTFGSGVRPSHTYTVAGTYNVILTLTDDRGVRASSSPMPVNVLAAANPVAAFTISPTDPAVGATVNVDASAATVPAGRTIVSYRWNFGDGTPLVGGQTAAHRYQAANTYAIVLTVTDDTGRQGVASQTVTVSALIPSAHVRLGRSPGQAGRVPNSPGAGRARHLLCGQHPLPHRFFRVVGAARVRERRGERRDRRPLRVVRSRVHAKRCDGGRRPRARGDALRPGAGRPSRAAAAEEGRLRSRARHGGDSPALAGGRDAG